MESVAQLEEPTRGRAKIDAKKLSFGTEELARIFALLDGVWTQDGYEGEDLTELPRDAEDWDAILEAEPDLAELRELPEALIFLHGEMWYSVPALPTKSLTADTVVHR
jgi:hypothetical protein